MTPIPRRDPPWRSILAIWFAGGLIEASQSILIMHAEGKHHAWFPLFATEFASWVPWALATPWIMQLARRYPVMPRLSLSTLIVHLGALTSISALAECWSAFLQVQFNPWDNRKWPTFLDTWSTTLIFQALTFLIAYALILTVTFLVDARESVARQMSEAARLSDELSKAQLAALRRQMEPHFMYNTLNAIAGLVRDQKLGAAISMIVGLSEFLRRSSDDSHRNQVTLAEEVDYLGRYLDIQKVRFGDRLSVHVDIGPELLKAHVPALLLQPLVENAIKHGVSKRLSGGAIRVSGARSDDMLCLRISNDGPAPTPHRETDRTGVGLSNLRTRLQILHGNDVELTLHAPPSGGAEVLVKLPFREA